MQCAEELITEFDTHSIFSLDPKGNKFLSSSERIGTEPEFSLCSNLTCTVQIICLCVNIFAHQEIDMEAQKLRGPRLKCALIFFGFLYILPVW